MVPGLNVDGVRVEGRTISGVTQTASSEKGQGFLAASTSPQTVLTPGGEGTGVTYSIFWVMKACGWKPRDLSTHPPKTISSRSQFHLSAHLHEAGRGETDTPSPLGPKAPCQWDFRVFRHLAHVILGFPYSVSRGWNKRSNPMEEDRSAP